MYKTVKIKEKECYLPAKKYCDNNGIKLQHFISEAITEKLHKLKTEKK